MVANHAGVFLTRVNNVSKYPVKISWLRFSSCVSKFKDLTLVQEAGELSVRSRGQLFVSTKGCDDPCPGCKRRRSELFFPHPVLPCLFLHAFISRNLSSHCYISSILRFCIEFTA